MNYVYLIVLLTTFAKAEEALVCVCGGFIISHVEIDYTKIEVELSTKDGNYRETTPCAPTSGYYTFPIYYNGEYEIRLLPPAGWSLTPSVVRLSIDGVNDLCSKGKDINFQFKGYGITGIVESFGTTGIGPKGITVELKSHVEVRRTITENGGTFYFTPVVPGQYTVSITHKQWRILKRSLVVNVNEGNTELPRGSLVISGYDVTGYVRSEGQLVDGIELVLFQDIINENISLVDGCKRTIIKDLEIKGTQLCHISSSLRGNFTFDVISHGNYFIIPYYKRNHIHFKPKLIKFKVTHGSLTLPETFKIVGYSVFGFVRASQAGKPLKGVDVFLNGNKITTTKQDGSYALENIKADTYIISVVAENMQFTPITLKVNQNIFQIPDFVPTLYKVCGNIISDEAHSLVVSLTGSTQTFVTASSLPDGKFCFNLGIGKYGMKVILNENENSQDIQFYPASYKFELVDSPITGITFSQLKATIVGKVICQKQNDCMDINVILKPRPSESSENHKFNVAPLLGNGTYTFQNVRQGSYEVSLSSNKFCWRNPTQTITVDSEHEMVPSFIQTGFLLVFISSHSSRAIYEINKQDKLVEIKKGKTTLCLETPGTYNFHLKSCHLYEINVISHNTNSTTHEIYLNAVKHTVTVEIESEEKYGDLYMNINSESDKRLDGPLKHKNKRYFINLLLTPNEPVVLVPQSDILFIYPPILSIIGQEDCTNIGLKFHAKKGIIFAGSIIPPLQGVLVTIEADNFDTLINETDVDGKYRFPPQDELTGYKVLAKKESYILFGPDENGNFIAHKLAEIIVSVVHHDTNKPLEDVLLSLSAGQGYRKNIPTDAEGVVTFHSLTPGEYFLKPMKKEYTFEPNTKLIVAEEGITIRITLIGKRFAYSGYGQVVSLNNDAEDRVTILASGLGNCSRLFEEATSDAKGQFRLRGLHPLCTYNVKVKQSVEDKQIERGSPSSQNISVTESDIHGLKFTVIKLMQNTDVLVRVYCKSLELYKTLRISLSRESDPSSLIQTAKLESYKLTRNNAGLLVYLPSLPLDGKTYYVQIESTSSHDDTVNGDAYYFTANTSFHYLDVDCNSQKERLGQNIKQTSLWTLLVIFATLVVFYNIEYTAQITKEQFSKLNIWQSVQKLRPLSAPPEFVIDKNEIDQIVESINPTKRKLKQRKA